MDPRVMKAASNFLNHYRKAFGDRPSLAIVGDAGGAKPFLEKASSVVDVDLLNSAKELASVLGLSWASFAGAAAPPAASEPQPVSILAEGAPAGGARVAGEAVSEEQWGVISKCAMKVGGPISGILVKQAKGANPASFEAAVDLVAGKLGSFEMDFRKAVSASR